MCCHELCESYSELYYILYRIYSFLLLPVIGPHQVMPENVGPRHCIIDLRLVSRGRPVQPVDVDLLRENLLRLYPNFRAVIILRIRYGSILLTLMLISAKSLQYYKDPEQRKALGEKITELLKTLRKEKDLEFSDFDGMNVDISEEDIQKAETFFNIGKYHNRCLNAVAMLTDRESCMLLFLTSSDFTVLKFTLILNC